MAALTDSDLPNLKLLSKGKVRDVYATSSPDHLLFVASDRISAYDVILKNGVPNKGKILTSLSLFWFQKLFPNPISSIKTHFVTANIDEMPSEVRQYKDQLEGRSMLVRKAKVVPLEAIVRGYITGSGWAEYKKKGTVHGIKLPEGLVESQKLPEPLFTPSTKAEQGQHDENISPARAAEIIGKELYDQISTVAVEIYKAAADYALTRGLILADTKFEFGLVPSSDPSTPEKQDLILIDELLTPDSSRYWPLKGYEPGKGQDSFDKQYLRNWLTKNGFKKGLESGPKGKEGQGWVMTEEVVKGTAQRYEEALRLLTQ
ncbi:Phosphoribosylaminoimidazole-succinocarboxamide synthase [Abortiporus biennis]